jgi:hypothetical protein
MTAKKTKIQARQELPAPEQRESIHAEDVVTLDAISRKLDAHILQQNGLECLGIMKSHPLTQLVKLFKRDIEELDNDPNVQLKIHTVGFWYWTINFPLIAYMFFFLPAIWLKWGLFITLIYSIYANWTSDYTGMSSAQSVINTTDKPVSLESEGLGTGVKLKDKK